MRHRQGVRGVHGRRQQHGRHLGGREFDRRARADFRRTRPTTEAPAPQPAATEPAAPQPAAPEPVQSAPQPAAPKPAPQTQQQAPKPAPPTLDAPGFEPRAGY
ncbi:hypothetical protein [Nocardia seriolae]|uniref:hypothetical protein n=1 Tax=Nocardia seriolae TaxID=37332 RepID=UPI000BBA5D9E|nr:hypothetical protein [Nocardia seriolae]